MIPLDIVSGGFGGCETLPEQRFRDIHLPEDDIHWPLHQMGFVHSTQVQNI